MSKRTYLDGGVLLAAFAALGDAGPKALEVFDDPDRQLVVAKPSNSSFFPSRSMKAEARRSSFTTPSSSKPNICHGAWTLSKLTRGE
jgi:hypothetical protein